MDSQPKPSDYVFSNQLLVGKIMQFYEHSLDTRFLINLRLLNRTINSIVLQRVRKEHENVEVCVQNTVFNDFRFLPKVELTRSMGMFPMRGGYLNFLDQVAKVKIVNFTIVYAHVTDEDKKILHEQLHRLLFRNRDYVKTFLGMKYLCENGCDECEYIVDRCQEYGPLQLRVLLSTTRRHFNKCINSDRDLVDIAEKLSKCAETREECLEMSEQMFDSNVSCDNLVFNLCEEAAVLMDRRRGIPYKRVSFPWELVQTMMKNWNVKSVDLKFGNFFEAYRKEEIDCTDVGFFTKFNWHSPFDNEDELIHKTRLQNVRIDLNKSQVLKRSVLYPYPFRADQEMAKNFLVAVTKPFPADKYQLFLSSKPRSAHVITKMVEATYRFIWRDELTHMRLDVALFLDDPSTTSVIWIESFLEGRPLTVTVNKWSDRVAEFSPGYPFESFDPNSSDGYSIRVRDSKTDIEVSYDIFYGQEA